MQGQNQGFVLNTNFGPDGIAFEPSFQTFKTMIGLLYDLLIDACRQSPRLETLLYQDFVITKNSTLKVDVCFVSILSKNILLVIGTKAI